MTKRRRVIAIVWGIARWAWANRHDAVGYELFVIREGREIDDYMSAHFKCFTIAMRMWMAKPDGEPAPKPMDLYEAWRELQKRAPDGGLS